MMPKRFIYQVLLHKARLPTCHSETFPTREKDRLQGQSRLVFPSGKLDKCFCHHLTGSISASYAAPCSQESQKNSKMTISESKKRKRKRTVIEYIPKLSMKNRVLFSNKGDRSVPFKTTRPMEKHRKMSSFKYLEP